MVKSERLYFLYFLVSHVGDVVSEPKKNSWKEKKLAQRITDNRKQQYSKVMTRMMTKRRSLLSEVQWALRDENGKKTPTSNDSFQFNRSGNKLRIILKLDYLRKSFVNFVQNPLQVSRLRRFIFWCNFVQCCIKASNLQPSYYHCLTTTH